jgi:prepilin signal peptidase PulO-like enzyme (type II secretory pathway)
MILAILILLGLALGSFVNALVWRLHEQAKPKKKRAASSQDLSIAHGRSMCPHCKHTLAWYDLLPVLSWVSLAGKCRYCQKPISAQYPVVELATTALFVSSYYLWPTELAGLEWLSFGVWLIAVVMFMALTVYDLRWMILPNRIVYPLIGIAASQRLVELIVNQDIKALVYAVAAAAIAGGIFHLLFSISDGNWIGGGDVKLGYALGLLVGTPAFAFLVLFSASLIGLLFALPGMINGKLSPKGHIPFGPCLLLACVVVKLLGNTLFEKYMTLLTG